MNFALSAEQEQLRRTLAGFLRDRCPTGAARRLMEEEDGFDRAVWLELAELGAQGLIIPEQHGGVGLGYVELGLALEEMGSALFCGPYLASTLATLAVLASGDDTAVADFLPAIASGHAVATLALAEPGRAWDAVEADTSARQAGDGYLVTGEKQYVLDGHAADLILVSARVGEGVGLLAVHGDAPGLERRSVPTLDQTRKQAWLRFRETPARLIGAPAGGPGLARTRDLAAMAIASEQVGCAQRCLDMSVAYARVREQFGRPVGSFQAIKHLCADMLVQVEGARSAARYSSWAAQEAPDELPAAASLAAAYCADAAFKVAGAMIQVHGGVGFTWDHDAHLYFKRAEASRLMFGQPVQSRERLLQRIGI